MPTRLRVDLAGYHHIINRGVNRCNVFNHSNDKDMFLQIVNKTATIHKVIIHDYVLMDNHYHLLIETKKENLPTFMRIINANYAQYFNRKYKRSGHLWQDRYKSKYITDENYLYILIRYIENNPVEANITKKIGEYPFTLASNIINSNKIYSCCQNSMLLNDFSINTLVEFLEIKIMEKDIKKLEEKEEIVKIKNSYIYKKSKELKEYFSIINTKEKRNKNIVNAYLDGYSQVEIGNYLNLSKSMISKIVKSGDSTSGV
jgi:REP element-mobilizing transposase RayT